MKKTKIKLSEQVAQLESDREWLYNQNVGLRQQLILYKFDLLFWIVAIAGWVAFFSLLVYTFWEAYPCHLN